MARAGSASGRSAFVRRASLCALVVAMACAQAKTSHAWVKQIAGEVGIEDSMRAIARDPAGDLIAVSPGEVVKYDGASGAPRWRVPLERAGVAPFDSLVLDVHGDALILENRSFKPDGSADWDLVKRSGADGRLLWRFTGPAKFDLGGGFVIDASGAVIVAGSVAGDLAALKLDARTGAQKWLASLHGFAPYSAGGTAIDSHGDVVVGGVFEFAVQLSVVTKISGSDGHLLWQRIVGPWSSLGGVAFDSAGDVLAAGGTTQDGYQPESFLVLKLDGASGTVRWRDASVRGWGNVLALDGTDGVVVAGNALVAHWTADGAPDWQQDGSSNGQTFGGASGVIVVGDTIVVSGELVRGTLTEFAVAAFALQDGTRRWTEVVQGDDFVFFGGEARGVIQDGDEHVFVTGGVEHEDTLGDALIVRLAVDDGSTAWQLVINETTPQVDESAASVARNPSGELVVGGTLGDPDKGLRAAVVKLAASDGSELWRTIITGLHGTGSALVDAAGDVLMAGGVTIGRPTPEDPPIFPAKPGPLALTVVKLAGGDGSELWRNVVEPNGSLDRLRSALDGHGDVVTNTGRDVVKLDGGSGAVRWRVAAGPSRFPGFFNPAPLAVDDANDVIAALDGFDLIEITKLAGGNGAVSWSASLPMRTLATAIALDGRGDVIVTGDTRDFPTSRIVTKLVGETGAALWTAQLGLGDAAAVAIDPDGDVIVAGSTAVDAVASSSDLSVVKLDGATSNQIWSYRSADSMPGSGLALVTDVAGDVFVAGGLDVAGARQFTVLKLDGARGTRLWAGIVPGSGIASNVAADDVALDGRGNVVAVGSLAGDGLDFAVASLDSATGSLDSGCTTPRGCVGGGKPIHAIPRTPHGTLPPLLTRVLRRDAGMRPVTARTR